MNEKVKRECRHKWRVGSGIGELVNKRIITTKLNIWCEKCDKRIKARYSPDITSNTPKQNKTTKEKNN